MKLVKLKLKNFRCYRNETIFKIDDLTAIIGKNDIGKSTILEAIDAFFNDKIDQSDLSNNPDVNSIELTCYFEKVPENIILDTTVPTSAFEEGILNAENQLEIKKAYTFGARKSIAVFLVANYPIAPELATLLNKKNTALKALAIEFNIDLTGVIKTKNPPIRSKIREHFGADRTLKELKVDGNIDAEDNLKAIWISLKKQLPVFSLFKVDKTLDDKDGDIQDPMKVAINEALALSEIQELLEIIEQKVKAASTAVADKTIEKLKDFDEKISEKLKSDFSKSPAYNKIFDLTLLNENDIPLNKRGSGIRRLVLLSFFQAQAEKRKFEDNAPAIIYAIEEPETSQHPNHQKLLIRSLIKLSEQQNVQVLFSSHNANLVREIPIESLRYISKDETDNLFIENGVNNDNTKNELVISKIIETLGILPNPSDKIQVIVYVEGNHDVNALKRYSHILYTENPESIDLTSSKKVGYVIAGGSSLKHYIEHKHLEGLGKPEVHIYDSDVPDYINIVQQINNENNPNKVAFNTAKPELESYLHHEAILEAYSENGINNLIINEITDDVDVPYFVAEKLYVRDGADWDSLDNQKKKTLSSDKKKLLNVQAVEKMNIERIQSRGGYAEMILWLKTINSFC